MSRKRTRAGRNDLRPARAVIKKMRFGEPCRELSHTDAIAGSGRSVNTDTGRTNRRARRRQSRKKRPARTPRGSKAAGQTAAPRKKGRKTPAGKSGSLPYSHTDKEPRFSQQVPPGPEGPHTTILRPGLHPPRSDPGPVRRATRTAKRPPKRRTAERGPESTHSPNRFRPCPG